jgi:hypothetical protein
MAARAQESGHQEGGEQMANPEALSPLALARCHGDFSAHRYLRATSTRGWFLGRDPRPHSRPWALNLT